MSEHTPFRAGIGDEVEVAWTEGESSLGTVTGWIVRMSNGTTLNTDARPGYTKVIAVRSSSARRDLFVELLESARTIADWLNSEDAIDDEVIEEFVAAVKRFDGGENE